MKSLRDTSQSIATQSQNGKCTHFWKEVKSLNHTCNTEFLVLTESGISREENIGLWGDHFKAIANSVDSADNRHHATNFLELFPVHNDINVLEVRRIVRGQKNQKAVGNNGIAPEAYKASSDLMLTMMVIFISSGVKMGKLQVPQLILVLIDHTTKVPSDVNNCRSIAIAAALSN